MPRFRTAVVTDILTKRDGIVRLMVKAGRTTRRATSFPDATGPITKGDKVVINTTGVDLELGTGSEDFVVWNLSKEKAGKWSGGHILKLRYTPWQIDTLVAEAPESPHHAKLASATSLEGMPVIACGLHSQVAPVAAMLKHHDPDLRLAYVMTDGAALPIAHSDLIATLKTKDLIDGTVTCGHAFGGDLETVNVFSGLMAASEVLSADVTIVSMGPGIVGTETVLGHTGMEQGQVISAVSALGGRPVAALRISFADERERHRSVSHHCLSALRFGTNARSTIAVPDLEIEMLTKVMEDLIGSGLAEMHDVRIVDSWETIAALEKFEIDVTTMGRTVRDDPAFFEAAGAAGLVAAQMIYESSD
ncbi:MAG: DUF3866 family protein [Actinomycetota bacterium]|nr:DUF3866 family protein [Actinomycetota bacterium]